MIIIIKQIKECKIKKIIISSMDYFPLNIKFRTERKVKQQFSITNNNNH